MQLDGRLICYWRYCFCCKFYMKTCPLHHAFLWVCSCWLYDRLWEKLKPGTSMPNSKLFKLICRCSPPFRNLKYPLSSGFWIQICIVRSSYWLTMLAYWQHHLDSQLKATMSNVFYLNWSSPQKSTSYPGYDAPHFFFFWHFGLTCWSTVTNCIGLTLLLSYLAWFFL